MNFSFDEQQVEFRAQLRGFLERECRAADVRSAFESARGGQKPDRRRWEQLASMGVVGLAVPEPDGGLGLETVDMVGLLEEAGRAGLPEPLAETAAVVVPFLVDVATEKSSADEDARVAATARGWLQRIATGEVIAAVIPDTTSPAVWAGHADLLVVFTPERAVLLPAAEIDTAGSDTAGIDTAGIDTAGIDTTGVESIDPTRRLATVTVEQGQGSVVVEGSEAEKHLARLRNRGAFATAAVLLGAADRLMSMTCEYALERHQFGRPIGSFQAVKHHLATAHVKLEMARPLTYRAAWSLDDAPDSAALDCSIAKATASEAALEVARVALQVHGAMGYTWEHDIHMWMKRIWVLAACWGDAAEHFAALLESLTAGDDR